MSFGQRLGFKLQSWAVEYLCVKNFWILIVNFSYTIYNTVLVEDVYKKTEAWSLWELVHDILILFLIYCVNK